MPKPADTLFRALDRLARSQYGQYGCGAVPDAAMALRLVRQRLVRPVDGRDDTWALTLRGWRRHRELLEAATLTRTRRRPRVLKSAA